MGVETACSTFTALAPLYTAATCTMGGVMGGYCDTGIPESTIKPSTTIKMEMTIAEIGLRMKKSLIVISPLVN
jgi:hypothetical protein